MQIIRYSTILSLLLFTTVIPTTIMIDPAGSARMPGRTIGDNFEYTVTYQLALSLKKKLEADSNYSVIITHSAGQAVVPLQNAHFCNRLNPDLYITISCYDDPDQKFGIHLYTLSYGDPFVTKLPSVSLVPTDKSHWASSSISKKIATTLHQTLSQEYGHQFLIHPIIAAPVSSLAALQVPALSIELNCHNGNDSNQYIEPLARAITCALS